MEEGSMQLVFIPWPVMGHVQIIEFAKLIIHRQSLLTPPGRSLSVTVLVMKLPDYIDTVTSSFSDLISASPSSTIDTAPRVNFVHLPTTTPTPEWSSQTRGYFISNLVKSQKPNVADYLRQRGSSVVGLVVDMLCTTMIDVAKEFSLPCYAFFTSPASFLGTMLHCQTLQDEENQDVPELRNAASELLIPCFAKPFPPKVLPLILVDENVWLHRFLPHARAFRKVKGIIINTFTELESYALDSFLVELAYGVKGVPPVYPVGPILNIESSTQKRSSEVLKWLDDQPACSVVFLCFGSQGSLREAQVHELARGIELSKKRFLWSLRRQSSNDSLASFPTEYTSYREVLPDGFLDRTAGIGKVVGWVPQLDVLSHPAVGGFVSHCGWNSVLESLWCGVPIATWPLHAEQQLNAFQLVRDLGLAVEITLSYHERGLDGGMVMAGEIERGIREVMDGESEVRKRVKEMRVMSRMAVEEGGSSYMNLERVIKFMVSNAPSK